MNVDDIKKMVDCLYAKDKDIALKFIENRDFYKLKELVDSSIIIHKKDSLKENPKEETKQISREDIIKLKDYVDSYLANIDPDYFDEINDLSELPFNVRLKGGRIW